MFKTFKQFLADKGISEDQYKEKSAEEMAALHKEYNEAVQKQMEDAIKGMVPKTELDNLIAEAVKGMDSFATPKQVEDLKTKLQDQGEALAALKIGGGDKPLSISDQIGKALEGVSKEIKGLSDNKSGSVRIELKAAGPMTFGNSVTGQIPQADREDGITRIPRRSPFLLNIIPTGPISGNSWEWVEQKNPDGEPAMTAEGEKKAQIDFDLELADAKVKKVTAFIKVSKEMLDDIPALRAEIDQELIERIYLKVDEQLLSGDGTGQNLVGLEANAIPFAASTFADTILEPNNADVLKVAINQVMINHFDPTTILLHPSDVTAMELGKASDGHYILPPFRSVDGTNVSGVRVIANTGVPQGEFIVADLRRYAARIREGLTIDVGYENDDFTRNFVTILAEMRLAARIKSNHYGAIVKGDFNAASILLEASEEPAA